LSIDVKRIRWKVWWIAIVFRWSDGRRNVRHVVVKGMHDAALWRRAAETLAQVRAECKG
jgi:hypothetical protein